MLKLTRLELQFLWRTIVLIGLILTAFVSALLSVISVLLDVPEGMHAGRDEYYKVFTVSVRDFDPADASSFGGTPRYAYIDGITRYSVMTGTNGAQMHTNPPKSEEPLNPGEETEALVGLTFTGLSVFEDQAEDLFSLYGGALAKDSRFPSAPGEIAINTTVARMVGVTKLGQTITFSPDLDYKETKVDLTKVKPESFTVVGFINQNVIHSVNNKLYGGAPLPACYYYVITQSDNPMSVTCLSFPGSRAQGDGYNRLARAGYEITSTSGGSGLDNIALAQAFFAAVALVLGVMVVFVLYSLIAIFYRQRKAQICRLKLLGAKGGMVAGIYCSIAVAIVFLATAVGTAFSMLFNLYFMNLCAQLFRTFSKNFVSHFRPIVPVSVFLSLSAFTLLLFFLFNRRVRNTVIAQEVRHE